MTKQEIKSLADNSTEFPKEFLAKAKAGQMLFVHKHGDLDLCVAGGGVLNRPTVKQMHSKSVLVVNGSKNLSEGHIFLGAPRLNGFVNAYVEKIEGELVYITPTQGSLIGGSK